MSLMIDVTVTVPMAMWGAGELSGEWIVRGCLRTRCYGCGIVHVDAWRPLHSFVLMLLLVDRLADTYA